MKEENILARIARNASEELIIKEGVYWNLKVLDIRWFTNGRPTKKGVRMNIDEGRILYNNSDYYDSDNSTYIDSSFSSNEGEDFSDEDNV